MKCFVRPNSDHFSGGRESGRQSQFTASDVLQKIIKATRKDIIIEINIKFVDTI